MARVSSSGRPRPVALGAVLAGGRSRRFGSDKGVAMLGDRTLIDHAIASLTPHVSAVVVCGRNIPQAICLRDRPAADMGPLGGLNAALHHAAGHGFDGVLSLGCDMPILPDEVADALLGDDTAVLAGQHLVGYWPVHLIGSLADYLAADNNRSIRGWLERLGARYVSSAGPSLPNINTPSDLAALARSLPGRRRHEPAH